MSNEYITQLLEVFEQYRNGLTTSDELADSVTLIVVESLNSPESAS